MDEEFEDSKLETITTVVYALQVLTYYVIFLGFIGIIINYVKKSEVEGTWLESHFQWQIKTFWVSFVFLGIAKLLFSQANNAEDFHEPTTFIGLAFYIIGIIWTIYRSVKGWSRIVKYEEV